VRQRLDTPLPRCHVAHDLPGRAAVHTSRLVGPAPCGQSIRDQVHPNLDAVCCLPSLSCRGARGDGVQLMVWALVTGSVSLRVSAIFHWVRPFTSLTVQSSSHA